MATQTIDLFNWMEHAPVFSPEPVFSLKRKPETDYKSRPLAKTPLMRQYEELKTKYPDAILLFRVGDFYEIFGEDAQDAAQILNITLMARAKGVEGQRYYLAGFPHHALDTYLPKLVRAGKRVAICEELTDLKPRKRECTTNQ